MNATATTCLWQVGATLGEGALWHAPTQSLYFVDIKQRRIHRCGADGANRHSWPAPQQVGFIVAAEGGGFVCGLQDGLYRFDPADGSFTPLCKVDGEVPTNRLNDGYVDASGRLWFGSMDDGESAPTGALYRYDGGAAPQAQDAHYVITNGPATSPDGRTLYHTDTLAKRTYAFDLLPDGSLANKRLFASFQGGAAHPDGMAVDAEGGVWIALFGGWRIDRFAADGKPAGSIELPCANITKLAFGGADLRTVFVTTARKGLGHEQLERQPLAGALFSFRSDTPGLAAHALRLQEGI